MIGFRDDHRLCHLASARRRLASHAEHDQVMGRSLRARLFRLPCPRHLVEADVKNRLKVLRAERDWSQADLATRLGVSRQAVNAVETGKYDPSLPLAFKLARVFGMSIEEIFEDEEARVQSWRV
jgi:putative transcriptional regulator